VGDVALLGIPGEPFTGIGREVKKAVSWALWQVLPSSAGSSGSS